MTGRTDTIGAKMIEKTNFKVLVVDDESQNVDLMDAFLSPYFDIVIAYNGKEALERVEIEKPDIILLDIMMPDMNGYEVCSILKSQPSSQFIPVIMITALVGRENRIEGIKAGADDFLTKPVDRLELITRVRSLLRIKELHDELVNERDKLDMQNRIRTILSRMIPQIFNQLPGEQKNILMYQMSEMVGEVVWESCKDDADNAKSLCTGDLLCDLMNNLGGSFSFEEFNNKKGCTIEGTACPWGAEEARENPILCNLTRSVFSKIVNNFSENESVEVLKTIGNGDECCLFEVRIGTADA